MIKDTEGWDVFAGVSSNSDELLSLRTAISAVLVDSDYNMTKLRNRKSIDYTTQTELERRNERIRLDDRINELSFQLVDVKELSETSREIKKGRVREYLSKISELFGSDERLDNSRLDSFYSDIDESTDKVINLSSLDDDFLDSFIDFFTVIISEVKNKFIKILIYVENKLSWRSSRIDMRRSIGRFIGQMYQYNRSDEDENQYFRNLELHGVFGYIKSFKNDRRFTNIGVPQLSP